VKQGEEIGKKEQTLQIARNALANGLSVELIATLTGFSEYEICIFIP
jgi:predicted transposase YdaD